MQILQWRLGGTISFRHSTQKTSQLLAPSCILESSFFAPKRISVARKQLKRSCSRGKSSLYFFQTDSSPMYKALQTYVKLSHELFCRKKTIRSQRGKMTFDGAQSWLTYDLVVICLRRTKSSSFDWTQMLVFKQQFTVSRLDGFLNDRAENYQRCNDML